MNELWFCEPCGLTHSPLTTVCTVCGTARPGAVSAAIADGGSIEVSEGSRWRCIACETVSTAAITSCPACGAPASIGAVILDSTLAVGPTKVVSRLPIPLPTTRTGTPPSLSPFPPTPAPATDGLGPHARHARNFGIAALIVCLVPHVGFLFALAIGSAAIVNGSKGMSAAEASSKNRTTSIAGFVMGILAIVVGFLIVIAHG